MGIKRRKKYPSKQTVNLAVCGNTMEDLAHMLPIFFICFTVLAATAVICIIWPFRQLCAARNDLEEMEGQLRKYEEYNQDYDQIEEDYHQRFRTYLTEEEASLAGRSQTVRLLEEKIEPCGKIKSVEIESNLCQVRIEEMPLSQISQLVEELEASPFILQVTVSTAVAGENRNEAEESVRDEGENRMAAVDLTVMLADVSRNN